MGHVVLRNIILGESTKVMSYCKNDWNITTLIAVDALFPNLEKITFECDDLSYSSFCKMVTKICKFKNLEYFPISLSKNQDNAYLFGVDFLKDRITSINLFDDGNNCRYLNRDLHSKLNNYPYLSSIDIRLSTDEVTYINYTEYLKTITENNLKCLRQLSILTANESNFFRLSTNSRNSLVDSTEQKIININVYSKYCEVLTEEFMVLIMNKFPNSNNLWFYNYGGLVPRVFEVVPSFIVTFVQFLKYLSMIPRAFFKWMVMANEDAIKSIEDFYTAVNEDTNRPPTLPFPNCRINNSVASSFTQLGFENSDSTKQQNVYFTATFSPPAPTGHNQTELHLIKHTGRFFDKIEISQIISSTKHLQLLNHIIYNCTGLKTLVISGFATDSESFTFKENTKKSHSLKTLHLLNSFPSSQEHFIHLLKRFPCLDTLVLKNCLTQKSSIGKYFHSICLPRVSLDYLEIDMNKEFTGSKTKETFYLKLKTDLEQKARYCFLKVKFVNGENIGYDLIEDSTEYAIQESILDQNSSTYLILFRSVENFTISYVAAKNGIYKEIFLLALE